MCCRLPSSFATSVDQWDSQAAAGICALCLLYAATRVEDISGQQDLCATVLVRHTSQIWFRSLVEVPQVQAKEQEDGSCDEYNSNERRILRDRSAILLGFKILLAEAYFEDVQALFGILFGNQGLVV